MDELERSERMLSRAVGRCIADFDLIREGPPGSLSDAAKEVAFIDREHRRRTTRRERGDGPLHEERVVHAGE